MKSLETGHREGARGKEELEMVIANDIRLHALYRVWIVQSP
jgi:hypothetical protein